MSFNWTRGEWEPLEGSLHGANLARWRGPRGHFTLTRSPQVDAILDAHVAFWLANNPADHALAVRAGRTAATRNELLLELLRQHGPLSRVPEYSYLNWAGVTCPARTIDLDDFAESSRRIARAWAT